MVTQHYRWDFIGLSSYDKPTPETSEKVVDGSTYYEADTSKLYVFYKDTWYEKTATGGGGGGGITELTSADYNFPTDNPTGVALWLLDSGWYTAPGILVYYDSGTSYGVPSNGATLFYVNKATAPTGASRISEIGADNTITVYSTQLNNGSRYSEPTKTVQVVQTTGTSTNSVMSQNATTSMVFADPANKTKVKIGNSSTFIDGSAAMGIVIGASAKNYGDNSLCIGSNSIVNFPKGVALGAKTTANGSFSVALGTGATASVNGELNVGTGSVYTTSGYNGTNYRLITGVHDGQNAQDAVTVNQVNATIDAINTTLSTNIPHIGA